MPPALRIESLWKCYAAGVRGCSARAWVLRGVSLTVEAGERVAVVGAAGSGKTTLAECILGLRAPTVGMVEITGRLEVRDLQQVGRSGGRKVGNDVRPPDRPTSAPSTFRPSDLPTSVLVLARRPDSLESWADRLLLLRDGQLHCTTFVPARRVAERSVAVLR